MPDETSAGDRVATMLLDRYRDRAPNALAIPDADGLVDGEGWLDAFHDPAELLAIARALDEGVVLVVVRDDHPLAAELAELAQSDEACMDTLEGRPWGLVASESAPAPPVMLILDPRANGPMPAAGDRCARCGAVYVGYVAGRHRWESEPLAVTGVMPCSPADHRTA